MVFTNMTGGGTGALRISPPIPVGEVIEIVKDRFYFATYEGVPSHDAEHHYFCTDEDYHYESFFNDFGPLNLAVLFRYCTRMQRKLKLVNLAKKRIIHYSSPAGQKRVNAAYLVGSFSIIYLNKTADEVCRLFSTAEPPSFVPFRDAAAGPSSYNLKLFDVFRSVEKAVKFKWLNFEIFDVDEYELYEKVENGDFNWIIPGKILAFCGPHAKSGIENGYPYHSPETYFDYFRRHNVTNIVRLNKKLYEASRFTNAGFDHVDLFFVDGSTPSDAIVCKFIDAVEKATGATAVHCKAGLGRTGTLIACYMMKHFKLTAAECMAWIRICRPGCIIGPQQQFLVDKQSWCWSMTGAGVMQNSGSMSQILSKVDDIKITESNNNNNQTVLPAIVNDSTGNNNSIVSNTNLNSNTLNNNNNNTENQLESEGFSQGDELLRIKAHRSSGRFLTPAVPESRLKTKPTVTTRMKKNSSVFSLFSPPASKLPVATAGGFNNNKKNEFDLPSPMTPTLSGPVRKAAKHKQGSDVASSSNGRPTMISSSAAAAAAAAAAVSSMSVVQNPPPSRRLAVPSPIRNVSSTSPTTTKVAVSSGILLGVDKMTGAPGRNTRRSKAPLLVQTPQVHSPAYFLRNNRLTQTQSMVQIKSQQNNTTTTVGSLPTSNAVVTKSPSLRQPLTSRKLPTVYKTSGSRRSLS